MTDIHFIVFPLLKTERLKLRKLLIDDIPSLVKYANNKKISDQIINIPHSYGEPDATYRIAYVNQGFLNKSRFVFAIADILSNDFIGEISLNLQSNSAQSEIGYWIAEPFWNKGFATEAIKEVIKFGFEKLKLTSILLKLSWSIWYLRSSRCAASNSRRPVYNEE